MNVRALATVLLAAALLTFVWWRNHSRHGGPLGPHPPHPPHPVASATPRPFSGPHPPAVLVIAPERFWNGWVDLDVLRDLKQHGFEPDFIESPGELKWEKLSAYDAAVVYRLPGGEPGKQLVALLNRFSDAGGGLLVMNACEEAEDGLAPLIGPWGAHIPRKVVRETDEALLAELPGTAGRYQLALTRNIAAHPATAGVHQLWLPEGEVARTGATVPLEVSADWTPLVRAAPTARLDPPGPRPPPARPKPGEPAAAPSAAPVDGGPVIAAARERGPGRVLLVGVWPEFTLGAGFQWPAKGAVLLKGARAIPSDGMAWLKSALAWLCEPGEKGGKLGGARTPPARLADPDTTPEARASMAAPPSPVPARPLLRGVIGAKSAVSGGAGTVAEWAKAATAAKLDYLVFADEFAGLSPDKFKQLVTDCQKQTTPALGLIPGLLLNTNLGGRVLVWGVNPPWPPKDALEGKDLDRLTLRSIDNGGKNVPHPPAVRWLSSLAGGQSGAAWWPAAGGWRAPFVRPTGAVVVLAQEAGAATDAAAEYREAIARGVPVLPLGVSRVEAPAELAKARILTVVQARTRDHVVPEALHWPQPYEAPHVFATSGPTIPAWGALDEVHAFAAADGQLALAARQLPLDAAAEGGLARLTVYDGERVVRHLELSPSGPPPGPFPLCALEQHALTLDVAARSGDRAISSVYRAFKGGNVEHLPAYDRANDQRAILQLQALWRPAEAPGGYTSNVVPHTGPPVVGAADWYPIAITTRGSVGDHPPYAHTWLDAGDEGALEVRFHADRYIEESSGVNFALPAPSSLRPMKVATENLSYVELCRPGRGAAPVGPPGRTLRAGPTAAILTAELESAGDQLAHSVRWLLAHTPRESEALTVATRPPGGAWQTFEATPGLAYRLLPVPAGSWVRLASPSLHRQVVARVKGPPAVLQVEPQDHGVEVRLFSLLQGREWTPGEVLQLRLLSWTDPTDGGSGLTEANALVDELDPVRGASVEEGKLLDRSGEVQVQAAQGRARLSLGPLTRTHDVTVPVTVYGLTQGWSAYSIAATKASTAEPVITPLAVDSSGRGMIAAHPGDRAALQLSAGHPVVASDARVLVTVVPAPRGTDGRWIVEANNPAPDPIEVTLEPGLPLPGLTLGSTTLTLAPGELRRLAP